MRIHAFELRLAGQLYQSIYTFNKNENEHFFKLKVRSFQNFDFDFQKLRFGFRIYPPPWFQENLLDMSNRGGGE